MSNEIIVVSGLPRSGTSLMMQLLNAGGIEAMTDNIRIPDRDNPRGYFEFERVKKLPQDAAWLPEARGKSVKIVSQLLFDLPATESYRVIFMDRDLDEVLSSQEKMLQRLGRTAAPREDMTRAFNLHLNRLNRWFTEQPHITVLRVKYAEAVSQPQIEAQRINGFLNGRLDIAAAVKAVDPTLYRNQRAKTVDAPNPA